MDRITEKTKVNEIIQAHPELIDYLMDIRLCRADAGPDSIMNWELSRAAQDVNMDVRLLVKDLNEKIRQT